MIQVRVLDDKFMIGSTAYKKGAIVDINVGAVDYCVGNGSCELVKPNVMKPALKKKVAPKKKPTTYQTKQTLADDIL